MEQIYRREFLAGLMTAGGAFLSGAALLSSCRAEGEKRTRRSVPASRAILILDRQSVSEAEGVTFHLNPAKKHRENPVLAPGAAHEWDGLQVTWPGTVLYDEEEKIYRCWYSGIDAVQKNRPPLWLPGYAESQDGLHWTKPDLGQYRHNDLPTNRIVVDFPDKMLSLVMKNPDQSNLERKYLSLWHYDRAGYRKVLASSPDGKVWKNEGFAFVPVDSERGSYFDIYQLLHQPDAVDVNDRFIGYAQLYRPYQGRNVRQIGVVHGPHPGALTPYGETDDEFVALRPGEGIDEEHHFASVLKVGDQTVMLFESDNFSKDPLHGDLRLAISSDGRKFRRVHQEQPLVATGSKGMWDENLLVTTSASMQIVGDEIRIYYFGCPGVYRFWPYGPIGKSDLRASFYYPSYLGLAVLPRDRFGYAEGAGALTTGSISLSDDGLWVNADGEEIRITCLPSGGQPAVKGTLVADAGESLYRRVEWSGEIPKGDRRIRIDMGRGERVYGLRY